MTATTATATGGTSEGLGPFARMTIRFRIAALTSLVVAAITVFMFAYFPGRIRDQSLQGLADRAQSIGELVAFGVSAGMIFEDAQSVSEIMTGLEESPGLAYVVIENQAGDIFASRGATLAVSSVYRSTPASGGVLDDPALYRVRMPITYNADSVGTVYLGFELASLEEGINKSRTRIALVSLVVLLLGVALAYVVGTIVTRPLRIMASTSSLISKGDLSLRAPVLARDEVGALAISFNRMVDTVEERTHQLHDRVKHEEAAALLGEKAVTANDRMTVMRLAADVVIANVPVVCCDILEFSASPAPVMVLKSGGRADNGEVGRYEIELESAEQSSYERLIEEACAARYQAEKTRCVMVHGHEEPAGAMVLIFADDAEIKRDDIAFVESISGILGQSIERCRAEEALRLSEGMHRAMVEAVPDSIIRLTNDGTVIDFRTPHGSAAVAARELKVGDDIDDHLPAEVSGAMREILAGASAGVEVQALEYSFESDDTPQYREARFVPYVHGEVLGLIRDITQRVTAEEDRNDLEAQMRHAEKLKSLGVLAGGIAHDFNNLLVGIQFSAGVLVEESEAESRVHALGEKIQTASDRATELTNQMLAYSGEGRFEIVSLRLDDLVRDLDKLLFSSVSKKVVVDYELTDSPFVRADTAQIRQVAMNLILNAADAIGDQEGTITVRAGLAKLDGSETFEVGDREVEAGRYGYLEVEDTGCGMDEETLDRIFDPFFTTKFTGRGLGLGAVHGIVRGHEGFLSVQSEPGVGTRFRMLIPEEKIEELAPEETADRGSDDGWVKQGTVLVVDDEEMIRDLVLDISEQLGYRVRSAADGLAGLEEFKAHSDEIVLTVLDMTMPRMDGLEVLREIRAIQPDATVVLSSGFNERVAAAEFEDLTPTAFLKKPYGPQEFRDKLREVLAPAV